MIKDIYFFGSILVYYEQLTLDNENTMKKILNYLNIDFNDYENKKVKIEKSTNIFVFIKRKGALCAPICLHDNWV